MPVEHGKKHTFVWQKPGSGRNGDAPSAAVFCGEILPELIMALGYMPKRLFPSVSCPDLSPATLPPFSCTTAKSYVSMLLQGKMDDVELFAFSDTCDTMIALHSIFQSRGKKTIRLASPRSISIAASRHYLLAEIQRIAAIPEMRFSEEVFRRAASLYARQRQLLKALTEFRDRMPQEVFFEIGRYTWTVHPEEACAVLEDLVKELSTSPRRQGFRVLLLGSCVLGPGLFQLLDRLKLVVAGDNMCDSQRIHPGWPAAHLSDIAALTYERKPCPCKHGGGAAACLDRLLASCSPDGVIIHTQKFCDPHSWDLTRVKQQLARLGVSYLHLETSGEVSEQHRLRLESFCELLEARRQHSGGR